MITSTHDMPPPVTPVASADNLFGPTISCPVGRVAADSSQPRKSFPEEELKQLAATIRTNGLLAPLLCRPGEGDSLILIAGERRYRAALMAGLTQISVRVATHTLEKADILELQLVENNARENLPPLELADSLYQLQQLRRCSSKELAAAVGLHESNVSRLLTLRKQPEPICSLVAAGKLLPAVAGEIAKLKKGGAQAKIALAEKAVEQELTRDKIAALIARCNNNAECSTPPKPKKKPARRVTLHLEQPSVELTLAAADGRDITLEMVAAALDAAARRARRLYQGAGDLDDLIKVFTKPPATTATPTQPGHTEGKPADSTASVAKPNSETKEYPHA